MCEHAAPLPTDLELCHEIIRQQTETIRAAQRRIEQLEHQLELVLRRQFGPRRERVDPNQLRLFTEDAMEDIAEVIPEEPPGSDVAKPKRHWRRKGRQRLPEDLPRRRVEHELTDEELPCPDCGCLRVKIGEEVSEQLEYEPSSLFVVVHARFRYACRACQEYVAIAEKPPQPIAKGLPGPGLLAQTVTSKYSDHRVQGKAVHEMRVGLSRSGCRTGPQTAGMLRWSRATVVSDPGNGATRSRQVRAGKANASEPPMTCRKSTWGVETGEWWLPRDQRWRSLPTASVTPGTKAARVRLRLLHGTLEPVAPMPRETPKWRPHEGLSTDAGHRGGTARSSAERRVMRRERRGRVTHVSPIGSTASAGGIRG
jgi:hypothetical protein